MRATEFERTSRIAEELQQAIERTRQAVDRSRALLALADQAKSPLHHRLEPAAAIEYGDNVIPFPPTDRDAAGFYMWDIQTDRLYGDSAVAELFGLDFRALDLGSPMMTLLDRVSHPDRAQVAKAIHRSLTSSIPFLSTFSVHNRWGIQKVFAYGRCFRAEDGEPRYWSGLVHRAYPTTQ